MVDCPNKHALSFSPSLSACCLPPPRSRPLRNLRYDERIDVWAIGVLAYHMASGRHPFQGRNQDETLENIESHRGISFPGSRWRDKSQLLKSFIDQLLKPKIADRPRAAEALRHPFLSAVGLRLDGEGDGESKDGLSPTRRPPSQKLLGSAARKNGMGQVGTAFNRMKSFSNYPDIKRAAIMAIAHKLHTDEIGHLRTAFQKIDTDNTGEIDIGEFETLAKA